MSGVSIIKTGLQWAPAWALAVLVPVLVSHCRLSDRLAKAESELTAAQTRNDALTQAVQLQNQQIERWEAQSKLAVTRFERASAAADARNKRLETIAETLKAAAGQTCNDAMPLVDQVIKAEKSAG